MMDSLLDEVDNIVTPDLSTDAANWCQNCPSLRQEIKRLQDEQHQNFSKLKQKIISTDLLIKKFKTKCDDYDVQCKKTEEANKRADRFQRQTEILETQLKAALLDTEPLRKSNAMLETELRQKTSEIQTLRDRLVAVESAQKQYEHLSRTSSADVDRLENEKKELVARVKYLEAGRLERGAAKEYRTEISTLKKKNTVLRKTEKRLRMKLNTAVKKVERLSAVVKDTKVSPLRRNSLQTSPFRSPSVARSRGSSRGRGRTRTSSERSSASAATEAVQSDDDEQLESDSSQLSDDLDESSSFDELDDAGSLSKVCWTFSPLAKCLSPLPPSPACFANRKHGKAEDVANSDEGSVSDIADELEQQLLHDDDNGDDGGAAVSLKLETPSTEDVAAEADVDKNSTDVTNVKEETLEKMNNDNNVIPVKINERMKISESGKSVITKTHVDVAASSVTHKEVKSPLKTIQVDNSRPAKGAELSLKQKLANSLEVLSPTAPKLRIAHVPSFKSVNKDNTVDNVAATVEPQKEISETKEVPLEMKKKTPPVQRSARVKSSSDSDHAQPESVDTVKKQKDGAFETSVKSPIEHKVTGAAAEGNDVETLSQLTAVGDKHQTDRSETVVKGHEEITDNELKDDKSCIKSVPASYIAKDENKLCKTDTQEFTPDLSRKTESLSDSEIDENSGIELKTITEESQSAESFDKMAATGTQETVGVDHKSEFLRTKQKVCDKPEIEGDDRITASDSSERKVSLTGEPIHKSAFSHVPHNKQKTKGIFGPDSFIKFQKSSVETLANEIEEFGHVDEYQTLSRDEKVNLTMEAGKMKLNPNFKKNIKRRLKKRCKYRDLDAQQNEDITLRSDTELGETSGTSFLQDSSPIAHDRNTLPKDNVEDGHEDERNKVLDNDQIHLNESNDKAIPSRQLSTGFVVNTTILERSSSMESAVSFRNSPRLLHQDMTKCDTITEENDMEVENVESVREEKKASGNTELIFGVEDLIADAETEEVSKDIEHSGAHILSKPFCDKTLYTHNDRSIASQSSQKLENTPSLSVFDDVSDKPGCSYHLQEPLQQFDSSSNSSSGEVAGLCTFSTINTVCERLEVSMGVNSVMRSSSSSMGSIDRASPVSPLSISPFNFLFPISPLPPSPVREIDTKSTENAAESVGKQEPDAKPKTFGVDIAAETSKATDVRELKIDIEMENRKNYLNFSDKETLQEQDKNDKKDKGQDLVLLEIYPVEDSDEIGMDTDNDSKSEKSGGKPSPVKSLGGVKIQNENETCAKKLLRSCGEKDESLKLSPLPHMVSPIRSPRKKVNTSSKVKTSEGKSTGSLSQNLVKKSTNLTTVQRENKKKPDRNITTKTELKPRITRSRASLDSSLDMCARKSGRIALKRLSLSEKTTESVAKSNLDSSANFCDKMNQSRSNANVKEDLSVGKTCFDTLTELGAGFETSAEIKQATNSDGQQGSSGAHNPSSLVDEKGDSQERHELSSGQDNLAFKRKTRVAHKPNMQPLKPKITVIEAPSLPPPSGRKRKSLDTGRQTKGKKTRKESVFQKQKSADSGTSRGDLKKMQAFLKSSELAESFVSKVMAEDKSGEDACRSLLSSCLQCLGHVKTDTLDIVYTTCVTEEYLNLPADFPYLSDVEKKAVSLIQCLQSQEHKKLTEGVVMRELWDSLFSRELSTSVVGNMSLCRVFVALCAVKGDLELARTMFYHLLTCGYMNTLLFVVPVVSVWPEVLEKSLDDLPDKVIPQGMTLVIEEIVTKLLQTDESKMNDKIRFIVQKLCHWSGSAGNAESVIRQLVHKISSVTEKQPCDTSALFETQKALELLCDHQTWEWVKDYFIMRYGLQTACNKYTCKTRQKPVSPDYMGAILQVTSHCLNTQAAHISEKDYSRIVHNWLIPTLTHKPGDEAVRQCCLETLLELSPLYPQSLAVIQKWVKTHQKSLDRSFIERLEEMRTQYKEKNGLVCQPFI